MADAWFRETGIDVEEAASSVRGSLSSATYKGLKRVK